MKTAFGKTTIARWRIDSDEERRLALLADQSESAKIEYVEYYRLNDPEYYQKGLDMSGRTIDLHRPDISSSEREKYTVDMVYSLHRFGCMFNEYFMFGFENLNTSGRESFVTDKIRWEYYPKLNSEKGIGLLGDKLRTYELFREYFGREMIRVDGPESEDDCRCFLNEHEDFIAKPIDGSGGRGIEFCHQSNDREREELVRMLCSEGGKVLEEPIEQDEKLASLHNSSVNTVRLPTVTAGGRVVVFHPILRMGVGASFTDNTTGGGLFAPIDPKTGILYSPALSRNGNSYIRHPDTGVVIPGFQLPCWDQAIELVHELAGVLKDVHYVGWDLAYTGNGWVMVEGNAQAEFVGWQSTSKRGVRRELDELISQIDTQ